MKLMAQTPTIVTTFHRRCEAGNCLVHWVPGRNHDQVSSAGGRTLETARGDQDGGEAAGASSSNSAVLRAHAPSSSVIRAAKSVAAVSWLPSSRSAGFRRAATGT